MISVFLCVEIFVVGLAGCGAKETAVTSTDEPISIAGEPASVSSEATEYSQRPAAVATPDVEPSDNDWELDTPENHGADGELLVKLHEAAAGETRIHSIVTAKDGYIIDEA